MPTRSKTAAQRRIAELERELKALKHETAPAQVLKGALKKIKKLVVVRKAKPRVNHVAARVPLAPGITLRTRPGSLYSTALKVYAALGHLDQHDLLFATFQKTPTPEAAVALLKEIGVAREELARISHR